MFGIISVYWNFICYLMAINGIYDEGSYKWEEDGKWFMPYGYIGISIYIICLLSILWINRKNKNRIFVIVTSMLVGSISTILSIFL